MMDGCEMIPDCCRPAVARVQRLRRREVCPVCRTEYAPDEATAIERPALLPAAPTVEVPAPRRASRPGAQPDARVQVATEEKLRPSSVAPVERLTHVEAPELVAVRRLLSELRPDRSGPLGWPTDGHPPPPTGSSWTPALRVQTSVETPAILPGAFASKSPASRAPDLDRGHPELGDEERATLRWCQRHGTLADGLGAFYVACALAESVSPAEVRDAWKVLPEAMRPAARMGYGRKRVESAVAAWWGKTATGSSAEAS